MVALYDRPQRSSGHVASLSAATRRAVSSWGISLTSVVFVIAVDEPDGGRLRLCEAERCDVVERRLARLCRDSREPNRLACSRLRLSPLSLSWNYFINRKLYQL